MKTFYYVIAFMATFLIAVVLLKLFGIYFSLSIPVILLLFIVLTRKTSKRL
ncbi:MAG: hypothetical protein AAF466_11310 [Bacteroidota bacterium]